MKRPDTLRLPLSANSSTRHPKPSPLLPALPLTKRARRWEPEISPSPPMSLPIILSKPSVCSGEGEERKQKHWHTRHPVLVLVLGGVVLRRHHEASPLPSSSVHYLHDVDHLRGGSADSGERDGGGSHSRQSVHIYVPQWCQSSSARGWGRWWFRGGGGIPSRQKRSCFVHCRKYDSALGGDYKEQRRHELHPSLLTAYDKSLTLLTRKGL